MRFLIIAAAVVAVIIVSVALLAISHAHWVGFDIGSCHGFYSKGWCLP